MATPKNQQTDKSNLVTPAGTVVASKPGPIFGTLEFSTPENAMVYENRTGKSTVAVIVKVPLTAIQLGFSANVYADLTKNGTVAFRCSLPKGITGSESVRDAFKAHVKTGLAGWAGYKRAAQSAFTRLTAVKADKNNPDTPLEWKPEPAEPVESSEPAESAPEQAAA
jgi:hypothetical protein